MIEAINRDLESINSSSSPTIGFQSPNITQEQLSNIQNNLDSTSQYLNANKELITDLVFRIESLESKIKMINPVIDPKLADFAQVAHAPIGVDPSLAYERFQNMTFVMDSVSQIFGS